MIAPRAEDAIAKVPDCTATRPRSSGTLPAPRIVWASSESVMAQVPSEAIQVQHTPVHDVSDGPAVEPEADDRQQPRQADHPDVEGGPADRIDLNGHGDLGEHRPDERRALPDQQAAVRPDREGPGIHGMVAQATSQGADLLDRLRWVRLVARFGGFCGPSPCRSVATNDQLTGRHKMF